MPASRPRWWGGRSSARTRDLTGASESAAQQADRVRALLETQGESFERITSRIASQLTAFESAAKAQLARIEDAVGRAVDEAERVGQALAGEAASVDAASRGASEHLKLVGEHLAASAKQVGELTARLTSEIGEVTAGLKAEANELGTSTKVAEERMQGVGRQFRDRARDLKLASEAAVEQVQYVQDTLKTYSGELTSALDKAASSAGTVSENFREQALALVRASESAESQARVIRENSFDSRRDMFLKASKFVIEDLNSVAIDLNRILDRQSADRLWSKFSRGDRGIFVRNMLADDDKRARTTISSKYHEDETFRKYVSRYLDQFERLLSEANESDPESLLSSTFLSADVGKLYLLLARSVGRLN